MEPAGRVSSECSRRAEDVNDVVVSCGSIFWGIQWRFQRRGAIEVPFTMVFVRWRLRRWNVEPAEEKLQNALVEDGDIDTVVFVILRYFTGEISLQGNDLRAHLMLFKSKKLLLRSRKVFLVTLCRGLMPRILRSQIKISSKGF